MKKFHLILISLLAMASVVCCEGFETITGEQSELGEVGTTLTGSFNGASDINVSVVSLDNGISTVAKNTSFASALFVVRHHFQTKGFILRQQAGAK